MTTGVNVDLRNPQGSIPARDLVGMRFVRFPINMGQGSVNPDLYRTYIRDLLAVGITPVCVITHQTFGEGQGFNFSNFSRSMSAADWARFFEGMVRVTKEVIGSLPVIIQVGNEQDSKNDRASVIIPPTQYGQLFRLFRTAFPGHKLATGGYCSGAGNAIAELQQANIIGIADYIANHPYGQGANGINNQFGLMADEIRRWLNFVPARKLMVTEFGIHRDANLSDAQLLSYMRGCHVVFGQRGLAGSMWYGASDGMDSHYGFKRLDGTVRADLRAELNAPDGSAPIPVDPPIINPPAAGAVRVSVSGAGLNVRFAPGIGSPVIGTMRTGDVVKFGAQSAQVGQHIWVDVTLANGAKGWVALTAALVTIGA